MTPPKKNTRPRRDGRLQFDAIDEVVIGDWLHAEHLGSNQWFVSVGDRRFWLAPGRRGMRVTMEERDEPRRKKRR